MSIELFFLEKPLDYGPYSIMGALTMTTTKEIPYHFVATSQIGIP
jgi:hypothetical protein